MSFAGFTLVSTIGFFATSMVGGMTYAMTAHRELLALATGRYTVLTVAGTIAGMAVALPLGASAVAIARTHVFPGWMAWFAGLVALVSALAALATPSTAGIFVPGSTAPAVCPVSGVRSGYSPPAGWSSANTFQSSRFLTLLRSAMPRENA